MAFQTEIEFTLPKGYLDQDGTLHTTGTMRLATAGDEILPLKDSRVQQNPAYLTIIVLSRVVTQLGSLPDVNPRVVEGLFASDVNYLQQLYEQLNGSDEVDLEPDQAQVAEAAASNARGSPRGFGVVGES